MEFWNSTLTEKSWKLLQELKQKGFRFILIGGWAAYLWTSQHKSKDIDIVLKDFNDLNFLKNNYTLSKNDSLKKYEIKFGDVDLDIYVPFFSKLAIPIEDVKNYTSIIGGFTAAKPSLMLVLKQGAEFDRQASVKGQKDRIDIVTLLLYSDIDFHEYFKIIGNYRLKGYYERLKSILLNFRELKYINMNPREFKLKKEGILAELRKKY